MIRHSAIAACVTLLVAACTGRKENADTTSVLAIDTVKPATTAAMTTDSVRTETAPPTKTSADTKTKAATKTKQGETKELGRDSIIRVDTKDKRRRLPPADTTRKP
jgi:hypothetical protein